MFAFQSGGAWGRGYTFILYTYVVVRAIGRATGCTRHTRFLETTQVKSQNCENFVSEDSSWLITVGVWVELETGQLREQALKQPSNIKNEMTKGFIGAQCPTWPLWKNSCRNNYFWNSHITMHTIGQPIRLPKQQQWREVWKKGMPPCLQFKAHLVSRLELDTEAWNLCSSLNWHIIIL